MTEKVQNPARRQKVHSAEIGTEVLKALARLGPSTSLSQLAEEANMPASKAHRYLKALISSGFAKQDAMSGRYALGPEALFLGLTALGRIDVVAAAEAPMAHLQASINQSCILSVWANMGPTVVKAVESRTMITVVTRIGSVLPMFMSATGLVFAAFLPEAEVETVLRREAAGGSPLKTAERRAANRRVSETQRRGVGIVDSLNFPGVAAIAAPVFGADGVIAAAVCMLGAAGTFDLSADGDVAQAVREAALSTGERIGYRPSRPKAAAAVKTGAPGRAKPAGRSNA